MDHRILRFLLVTSMLIVVGVAPTIRAEVYGLKTCGSDAGCGAVAGDPSRSPATLFSLSDDGLILNVIGPVTVSGIEIDADALAVSTDQRLFAYELLNSEAGPPSGSRLIEIDPATAVATPIGPEHTGREMRGAVFDGSGKLRVFDSIAGEVLEIDIDNGLILLGAARPLTLGGVPFAGSFRSDLAVRTDGQLFYVEVREVYALDGDSGALTLLSSDQAPAIDGLGNLYMGASFSPVSAFDLFALDARDTEDIFVYDTAANYARQELHSAIIPAYNAGLGDLGAGLPLCPNGPGEVGGLQLGRVSAGTELLLTWNDEPNSAEYAVFDDVTPEGQIVNFSGSAVSGVTGLQLPMPGGNAFFLVAGVTEPCIGPR